MRAASNSDSLGVFGRQCLWWGLWALGGVGLVRLAAWTWTRWRSVALFVISQLALCGMSAWAFDLLYRQIDERTEFEAGRRPPNAREDAFQRDDRDRRPEREGRFDRLGRSDREGRRVLRSERVRAFRFQRQILVYWLVIGAGLGVRSYLAGRDEARRRSEVELRAERLRAELARAELESLRSELNPHFLFNALHAVGGLVRAGDAQTALKTLTSIGDLLRKTLDRSETQESSLQDEFTIAEQYLAVERLRFGDRLTTSIELPTELASTRVPSLVLLPLVENAVRYAVESRTEGGRIEVRAHRDGERVVIEVSDDGPGFPSEILELTGPAVAEPGVRRGIGLANTRARVEMLYGPQAGLELSNRKSGGARIRVRV